MVISRGKKDKTINRHELMEEVIADLYFVVPDDDVNFAHQVFIKYLQKALEEQESHDSNSNFHSSTDSLSGESRHSHRGSSRSEYPYRRDGRSTDYRHDRHDRPKASSRHQYEPYKTVRRERNDRNERH
eukprot:GHVP01008775.1.p1 GENE.GHVP01008775.1~~GHVP01008775.1.p1  ORF type:complete len:129 (-),score=16.18 GHVP01008775.1:45-431(-)